MLWYLKSVLGVGNNFCVVCINIMVLYVYIGIFLCVFEEVYWVINFFY